MLRRSAIASGADRRAAGGIIVRERAGVHAQAEKLVAGAVGNA
jgi:hypothetical protein